MGVSRTAHWTALTSSRLSAAEQPKGHWAAAACCSQRQSRTLTSHSRLRAPPIKQPVRVLRDSCLTELQGESLVARADFGLYLSLGTVVSPTGTCNS